MNIVLTTIQLQAIKRLLEELKAKQNVSEFDILYNQFIEEVIFIRYKSFYTTEEGVVATEINYLCINRLGQKSNCVDEYGDELYAIVRDCVSINISSPLVKII